MVRLTDKVRRLQALARRGSLNNEAAVDSFMDIAVYALIARILYEETLSPDAPDAGGLRLVVSENLEREIRGLGSVEDLLREAGESAVTDAELRQMAHDEWAEQARADERRLSQDATLAS